MSRSRRLIDPEPMPNNDQLIAHFVPRFGSKKEQMAQEKRPDRQFVNQPAWLLAC